MQSGLVKHKIVDVNIYGFFYGQIFCDAHRVRNGRKAPIILTEIMLFSIH